MARVSSHLVTLRMGSSGRTWSRETEHSVGPGWRPVTVLFWLSSVKE